MTAETVAVTNTNWTTPNQWDYRQPGTCVQLCVMPSKSGENGAVTVLALFAPSSTCKQTGPVAHTMVTKHNHAVHASPTSVMQHLPNGSTGIQATRPNLIRSKKTECGNLNAQKRTIEH